MVIMMNKKPLNRIRAVEYREIHRAETDEWSELFEPDVWSKFFKKNVYSRRPDQDEFRAE